MDRTLNNVTPAPEAERRDPDNYENSERSIQHDDAVERREVMKKFEIVIRGANEEAVAHAVMVGVYGAIRKYKHTDVSVQAATVKEGWVREVDKEPEIQIPEFLNRR